MQDHRKLVAGLLLSATPLFEPFAWAFFGNSAIGGALGTLFGDNLSPAWGNRVELSAESGHTIVADALNQSIKEHYDKIIGGIRP